MAEEVSPESKLYVKEEIERSRKEFKEDLKYAQSRATRTFATIAMIVGLLGSLGIYGLVKSVLNDTTIKSLESNATEKFDKIVEYEKGANKLWKSLSVREKIMHLPIGTIVASMLAPDEFAVAVGNPDVFDANESYWALADGKDVITDSQYYQKYNKKKLPDLRGMFLRGMNVKGIGADPDNKREVGTSQDDALQEHGHKTTATGFQENVPDARSSYKWNGGDLGYSSTGNADLVVADVTSVTNAKTNKDETRPKNVAVYFYIKIN